MIPGGIATSAGTAPAGAPRTCRHDPCRDRNAPAASFKVRSPDKAAAGEAIFNTHPEVHRTALVGAILREEVIPVICYEKELAP